MISEPKEYIYCRVAVLSQTKGVAWLPLTEEDVIQETYLRYLQSIRDAKLISNPFTFIYGIAKNVIRDQKKSRKRLPLVLGNADLPCHSNDDIPEPTYLSFVIEHVEKTLTPACRQLLHYIRQDGGFHHAEAALDLSITHRSSQQRLYRIKQELKSVVTFLTAASVIDLMTDPHNVDKQRRLACQYFSHSEAQGVRLSVSYVLLCVLPRTERSSVNPPIEGAKYPNCLSPDRLEEDAKSHFMIAKKMRYTQDPLLQTFSGDDGWIKFKEHVLQLSCSPAESEKARKMLDVILLANRVRFEDALQALRTYSV